MVARRANRSPVDEIGYGGEQDLAALEERIRRLAVTREIRRHVRLEWLATVQQGAMMIFIVSLLLALAVFGIKAGTVILTEDAGPHVETAWRFVSVLIDAGIAAGVGFFAVKTFER